MHRIAKCIQRQTQHFAQSASKTHVCSRAYNCNVGCGGLMSGKRSYSSDHNDKDSKNSLTDTKHEILASRFVDIVRNAEAPPQKEHVQKVEIPEVIEEKLIQKMELLFSQNKPAVTEELLEARRKLREKYPKLFENITDEELDS